MSTGDKVIVTADPLAWGIGTITGTTPTGRIAVEFTPGHEEQFDAHELELHATWASTAHLADSDLNQLRA